MKSKEAEEKLCETRSDASETGVYRVRSPAEVAPGSALKASREDPVPEVSVEHDDFDFNFDDEDSFLGDDSNEDETRLVQSAVHLARAETRETDADDFDADDFGADDAETRVCVKDVFGVPTHRPPSDQKTG